MARREQVISTLGVIALALALPIFLKLVNSAIRFFVGAEGRLAAITMETDHALGQLPRPWQALAQGGEELKTFLDNTGPKVAALGPRYIRLDHLYDGFNVVSRSGAELQFNWTELDAMVDKIRATGAMPFLSLTYMPPVISKGDIVDEPRDWNEWALVVQKTIEHYCGEKGLAGVYYEVWNEPDLFGKWTMGGKKDYKRLYSYASVGASRARGVREFKLGGPATTGLYKNWMDSFFPFILENNLRLDFFSWHRYDLDLEKYTEDVTSVKQWLDSHPYFSQTEMIISEMGPSSDKAEVNNSRLGAMHTIATARELMFKIKYGFNFSIKDPENSKGGWGLINSDGSIKPRYAALTFLGKLGPERMSVTGEGSWVRAIGAKRENTYQVLLVNYDPRGTHSEVVPVTFLGKPGNFLMKQTTWGGGTTSSEVATTEGMLQREIPMTPNSAVLVELTPR